MPHVQTEQSLLASLGDITEVGESHRVEQNQGIGEQVAGFKRRDSICERGAGGDQR